MKMGLLYLERIPLEEIIDADGDIQATVVGCLPEEDNLAQRGIHGRC